MLFTEPRFLFFVLPLVLLFYYLSPRRAKNAVLLIASIFFYGFGEGYYTAVILFSIVFNYFAGHVIDQRQDPRARRGATVFAVAVNLGLIVAFKYSPFIVDNLDAIFHAIHAKSGVIGLETVLVRGVNLLLRAFHAKPVTPQKFHDFHLPLGISFFTFHAISYIIDVHRREVKPMKKFHNFALYITLFPQLVAGPIIRYKTICDQFALSGEDYAEQNEPFDGVIPYASNRPAAPGDKSRRHSIEQFAYGIRRFIIGLGKKMLIANIVAVAADGVFATPHAKITPAAAWLGVFCYTLQIYFDFSGYSDMAIGLGHMFGFKFPENFNYPYISKSVTEFWRRWHMSLSTWFRDYLYIPLGGNRVSPGRTYFNLLVVFFLCGFWHGATWNFITWGLYFGVFLILERLGFGKWLEKSPRLLQHIYLLVIVMVGWVFFRSPDLTYAARYIARMAFFGPDLAKPYVPAYVFLTRPLILSIAAALIGSIPWLPAVQTAWNKWTATHHGFAGAAGTFTARSLEVACLAALFLLSAGSAAIDTYQPFIYFHF